MQEQDNTIQIWFYCCSEKNSAACCAYAYDIPDSSMSEEELYESFLYNAAYLEEAFAEVASDFEPGLDKAKLLVKNGDFSTLEEAIKDVFGRFLISCEVNGKRKEINWDIDDLMYSMIFEHFGVKS